MPKKEKNKFKDNIVLKEMSFFVLVLFWILLIFFKKQLPTAVQIILFIVLVLLTIFGLIWLNKAFLGMTKDKE
ncbi:MAG: hypothetical protein ACI31W_09290 [Lactococcus sp.]